MLRLRAGVVAAVLSAATVASATYAGADGKIAFVRSNQIYTMTSTGTAVTKLTSAGKNYRPKWSPDGTRISYIHESAGGAKDVWVMGAAGGGKQAVTRTGDVTSAGAAWSPNGRTLAFSDGTLETVRSTAPFGTPVHVTGYQTGSEWCGSQDPAERHEVSVDRFLAWSPDGTRIALFNHSDCYYDDAVWMYYPATGEVRQLQATGADSSGYHDWLDLFWGAGGRLGYTDVDRGDYGEDAAPSQVSYPGYVSAAGDAGGAPSPSGTYLAVTNASSGTARVFRVKADGTGRTQLTSGYQPDWQPRP